MAFADLAPVRVTDEKAGCTYIIGEVFAIYTFGGDRPFVYEWSMVRGVIASRKGMTIILPRSTVSIDNKDFDDRKELLRAIAIVEHEQKKHGFDYSHERRLFPLKSAYVERPVVRETFTGISELDETDVANAFVMLMNYRLMKVLWLVAVLFALVMLGILQLAIGITRDNILYFIPISIAVGGISALLVYFVCHAVAKGRYKSIAADDLASGEEITFVVSTAGFAACESCNYEGRDLVPWSEMDYFIESDKLFILYKDNFPAAYIYKRAFEKKEINAIADIIALNLEQK